MFRKRLMSLAVSASLLTGGVAMVALEATPAIAQSAKAKNKKKIKQKNRQSNRNRTNQTGGDARSGNVQCIVIGGFISENGPGDACSSGAAIGGSPVNVTAQINNALNTAAQLDTGTGNAVGASNG